MTEYESDTVAQAEQYMSESNALLGRLFDAAAADAVFGEPITAGETTVLTASEILVGMGVGGGAGFEPEKDGLDESQPSGGYGGGGGGFSHARPVAAISVGPDGVQVSPIVDTTKLGLAFLTSAAAILVTLFRIRGAIRSGESRDF